MAATFLVGMDFSDAGRKAFDAAVALGSDMGARLVLVHAFPRRLGINSAMGEGALEVMQQYQAELEATDAIALSVEWAAAARDAGLDVVTVARDGPPADALLEEAEEQGAALIVVGSHGRSRLAKLLLGSVAEDVVRRSQRPVLVVPTRE